MPFLDRPDGGRIFWEERGEGPLVALADQCWNPPHIFERLIAELANENRVVRADLRGNGQSSPEGPFDLETDIADLEALIEEAGGDAVMVAMGDGCLRAINVAARRPELVRAMVTPAGSPIANLAVQRTEGLAGSESVVAAIFGMLRTDFRSGLRAVLTGLNTDMDEDEVRERVNSTAAYASQDGVLERLSYYSTDENLEPARAVGEKVWVLSGFGNAWFPESMLEHVRELLPEAHVAEVEDGAISRPDITASYVRRIRAAQAAEAQRA